MTTLIAAILPVVLLALSMSTDAFAAAIGKGARLDRPSFREALRTGLIFGSIEAVTPLLGWAAGKAASSFIAAFYHWIAFAILTIVGCKMILDALRRAPDEEKPRSHSLGVLVVYGHRHQHRCAGGGRHAGVDRRQHHPQRAGYRHRDLRDGHDRDA